MRSATSDITGYDAVTRLFHWLTAFLILSAAALGLAMTRRSGVSEAEIAETIRLYTLHKAIGLATLATALARIGWAVATPRPGPLHPGRRAEVWLAGLTHWMLYGAMLVLPLSGWIFHTASPAFAPIPWPFAQGLPFVETSERVANLAGTAHRLAGYALFGALLVHLTGAFKHAIVDMDATLARMTSGHGPVVPAARLHAGPAAAAALLWTAVLAAALYVAPVPEEDPFADIEAMEPADLD
jgi:cytochrome b561